MVGSPSILVAVVLSAREQGVMGPGANCRWEAGSLTRSNWGEESAGGGIAAAYLRARLAVRAVVAADGRESVWRKQRLPPTVDGSERKERWAGPRSFDSPPNAAGVKKNNRKNRRTVKTTVS